MEPNNKNIEISLFRVSTDSKYLDMIFSCPQEYYFTSLQLEMKYYDYSDKVFKSKHYDLSPALFNSDPESSSYQKKHWTIRLPLEKIQDTIVPAIYKSVLKAKEIVEEGEYSEELSSIMVCSDVNYAYRCMLHDLLDMDNLSDECAGISDEAIRKYLLLYGH